MLDRNAAVFFGFCFSLLSFSQCLEADIVINWSSFLMPTTAATATAIPTAGATFSGNTTGDEAIPFTLTLTKSAGTNAWFYRGTQGGVANSLCLMMGDPSTALPNYFRSSTDKINCVVTFAHAPTVAAPPGLYWGSNFTMLDIDIGGSISDWQDQLTVNTAGGSMKTLTGSTVKISGNKATGTTSVAATATAGNVITRYNSLPLSFSFSYSPSAADGLVGLNQIVGVNGVGFSLAVPEPNSVGVIATLVLMVSGFRRRRKNKA